MATLTSPRNAQDHYDSLKSKIKFLPDDLKEIVSANLADSLQTDFSALSPEEMKEMKSELSALMQDPNLSDAEKKQFEALWLQIGLRYPTKVERPPEELSKLVSRDNFAYEIEHNRAANYGKGRPTGEVKIHEWENLRLEEMPFYSEIVQKYQTAFWIADDEEKQKRLHQLDSQFAERIILQRNEYIQIDNELLQPGDTNYKSESQIIADAQKAMKDLNRANLGYKVEYVVIGGNGAFDDVYRAELEEKLQKLKEWNSSERIRNVRLWAVQELLSEDMTPKKLKDLIDLYQLKVDQESEYNVGNHEPLLIFKDAEAHFGSGKKHHVVRKVGVDDPIEIIETPKTLTLKLKGDNPLQLKKWEAFVDPGAEAKHGEKDVSDQITVEGEVDTSKSGKYEITYSIEVDDVDEAGKPIKKKQEKIRIVEVVEIPDDKLDIILNGDDPMEVKKGETFVDPGATATLGGKRIPDEEIEIAIKNKNTWEIVDSIATDEIWEYEITYTITKEETIDGEKKETTKSVKRTVQVKDDVEEIDHTLTLEVLGDNPATLQQGDTFVDEGAIATRDGEDVSEDIKVTGTVDTNTPGTYEIVYTIKKEYIDHEGKKKTKTKTAKRKVIVEGVVVPPPEPDPEPEETFDISGVLSNVTESYEDMISREVENELKDEWNNMARYNPKRFTRFFNRGRLRKKRIKEKKKSYGTDPFVNNANINDEMSAQADRHELELQNRVGKVEKKTAFKLQPATATALNQLGKDFIEGKVTEFQFQKAFNDLLKNDDTVKSSRKEFSEKSKPDFLGTNILEKLKHVKAERALNEGVKTLLESLPTTGDKKSVEAQIMKKISDHVLAFQKDPRFRAELERSGGKIDDAQLLLHLKDKIAKEQLALGNLNIKLDLLDKGEGAYQINNKDRENWVYKFGHWMDKLPRWGQALVGVGMWGIIMGSGGLATALGASAVVAGGVTAGTSGLVVGFRTFVKKWTHHTKEQNTHEKDTTRDFANVQAKMAQWRSEKDDKSLSWWKRYKAKRQYELYETTTQSADKFADTRQLSDLIMKGVAGNALSVEEENAFNAVILDAYARLDFYRNKGHNYLKSENVNQIEQDFRALEKSLQLVAERQGGTLTDIPALIRAQNADGSAVNYNALRGEFEKDYQKARTKFWQERARLATKWGLTAGALAVGASVASQYFTHSGLFSEQHEAANINLGDAQTDFAHNGTNLYEDTAHNVANKTKAMLDPATHPDLADASKINVNVYSGTDTVAMMNGQTRATLSEYTRLLNATKDYINTTPLDATTKANALEYLNNHTWENVHGMTNDYLGYMRGLKSFEGIVQGHIDSWSTIPLDFHYVTGTNTFTNKVGGGILNITEKAVDGAFGVKDRILASFIPVVAGLTSNTFRRNGKEVEKPQYGKDAILVRNNKQGEVDLVKVDTNNRPLAGAKFVVKDANGKVIDSWETTDQPHKITGLNAGTYTIVETDPPAGHQLSDEAIELTVDGEGNVTKRKIERSQVPVTVEEKGEKDKGKPNNKEGDNNSKLTQMLEKGTKINEAEHTPLTKAIVGGNSTEVDRLSKSVDRVNEQLDNGLTPLMVASIQNHPDQNNLLWIVKKLIEAGADVNTKDKNGMTALDWAALNGSTEIVKELIKAGADANAKDKNGMTALDWAKRSKEQQKSKQYDEIIKILEQTEQKGSKDKKETINEKDKESIEKVFGEYPQLKKLYTTLLNQGKIKKLVLDDTTFVSTNDRDDGKGAIITLGGKYHEGMRYQQDKLFKNQTDDLARKLAHELMHSVMPTVVMKENSPMADLFTALKEVREHDEKKGLSMLVSKYPWSYKGAGLQASEDMTELFAMYAIKPDHLKEYLTDYLVNISDAEADRLGLKKLTPEVGKHIYELVDTLLKKIMKGDLSGIESQIKKEKTTEEKPEGEENSEELNEKKNKETLELLKKATWTNKKGKKEILFESEKIGMAMDKWDLLFVAGKVNRRWTFVSGTQHTVKIAFPDGTEQEINLEQDPVFSNPQLDFARTYQWKGNKDDIAWFIKSTKYKVPRRLDQDLFEIDDYRTIGVGDEVFVAGTTNKKGKVTSLIDNALSSSSEGAKLLVITLEDGEEYKTAAIFVKSPVYSLNRIQAMMKWAGIKKETIDDESDIDKEKEEKEKAEKEKLARLNEIKGKITNQTFIDALKETTKESESLSITGIDNNDLNKNRSAIVDLLPKLKQLKIEGTKSDQLSTDPSARNKLDENILQFFRTNIETLELPNNYLTDLSWLRGQSQLKKIDVSDNGITTINYDDLQDLPAGCEIILKGNNPISQEIWDKNIANRLKLIK